jgi:hypothetical protein
VMRSRNIRHPSRWCFFLPNEGDCITGAILSIMLFGPMDKAHMTSGVGHSLSCPILLLAWINNERSERIVSPRLCKVSPSVTWSMPRAPSSPSTRAPAPSATSAGKRSGPDKKQPRPDARYRRAGCEGLAMVTGVHLAEATDGQ